MAPLTASALEFQLMPAWDSKYASEGRNQLAKGGLYSLDAYLAHGDWGVELWHGRGDQTDYRETDATLEYVPSLGKLTPFVSITRLRSDPGRDYDSEVALGGEFLLKPWLIPGIEATYSHQAEGTFVLLSLRTVKALSKTVSINGRLSQGLDYGYTSEAHDGPNHQQLDVTLSWQYAPRLSLFVAGHHSWAGEDVRRDGGGDLSWFGVGLNGYF
ncbi:hypothetical protein [Alcanivorax hongdengensis]|nr:hypothetical protein [Alcanivorax hongdengensis]